MPQTRLTSSKLELLSTKEVTDTVTLTTRKITTHTLRNKNLVCLHMLCRNCKNKKKDGPCRRLWRALRELVLMCTL